MHDAPTTEDIMLKFLLAFLGVGAAFFAGGRVAYSGLQLQVPFGSAIKMTPDPSNIWSFHESVVLDKFGKSTIPVVVDFDSNQRMDTENAGVRVMITDIQCRVLGDYVDQVRLHDDSGVLWEMNPRVASGIVSEHMTTPLVLPVGSRLTVELEGGNQPTIRIHIVGRLVTM
jgi:hypothetical protein